MLTLPKRAAWPIGIALSSAITVAGGWGLVQFLPRSQTTLPDPIVSIEPHNQKIPQVYWVAGGYPEFQLVPVPLESIKPDTSPKDKLAIAFEQLLTTPPQKHTSSIPAETQLRRFKVMPDGIYVDLSSEFQTGGGSAAMITRLGQIVYTASSLSPESPIWLSIEGEALTTLGGEGLIVEQPLTRASFNEAFPL
ncbi:MAG: GerMN domain-containing protein [Cyanobacteria bacterium P01_H01_bin.15]